MKTERLDNGNIRINFDGTWLSGFSGIVVALSAGWAAYEYFTRSGHTERIEGLIGVAVMFFIMGFVVWEKSSFLFDAGRKEVTWEKGRYLKMKKGKVHFNDITHVVIGTPIGDDGLPSQRIELITKNTCIPITDSYKTYSDDFPTNLASEIRTMIGLKSSSDPEVIAQELHDIGRVVEAVKILKTEKGMSTTKARKFLDPDLFNKKRLK